MPPAGTPGGSTLPAVEGGSTVMLVDGVIRAVSLEHWAMGGSLSATRAGRRMDGGARMTLAASLTGSALKACFWAPFGRPILTLFVVEVELEDVAFSAPLRMDSRMRRSFSAARLTSIILNA